MHVLFSSYSDLPKKFEYVAVFAQRLDSSCFNEDPGTRRSKGVSVRNSPDAFLLNSVDDLYLHSFCTTTMSSHDNEELIDYEDEHDVIPNGAVPATSTNGATASTVDGEGDKDKKNFSGIHSTGFRFVSSLGGHKPYSSCELFPFSQGLLVET